MSQHADIAVLVEGLAGLFQAIAEAGAQYRAERVLRTADGKVHDVDYVVTDGQAELGVKLDQRTKQVVFVPQDGEAGRAKALQGRVLQRYAYSRVLSELKQKGYQVATEEKQRDGTVKVVMTRWR